MSPGQTLQPFSVIATGGAPNDPKWSILSAPVGTSLSGSTLSLSASATPGAAVVVEASDSSYSATATIATVPVTPKVATSSFAYHRTLTIGHHSVGASDLSKFPVAVSIVDQTLANQAHGGHVTNANGYDIVVASDSEGKNLLNW